MPERDETATTSALLRYVAVLSCLFQLAWLIAWIQSSLFQSGYPYDSIFFNSHRRFTDFTIYLGRLQAWREGRNFFTLPGHPFTYPAPCFYAFALFDWLVPFPVFAYLTSVVITAIGAAAMVVRAARLHTAVAVSTVVTLLLSYPLLFLLDRGNIEGLVWGILLAGVVLLTRERTYCAAGAFGVAAAMKIFPGLLLLLLLSRRRYREFAFGVGCAFALTACSLLAMGPDFMTATRTIGSGLEYFRLNYALKFRAAEIGFDHSLFACAKHTLYSFRADAGAVENLLPVAALF